jgi:hypothetical protein
MSDVKDLIGEVSSLKAVNDMQLLEMQGIKEGFEKFKCGCHQRHAELERDLASKWETVKIELAVLKAAKKVKETVLDSLWARSLSLLGGASALGVLIVYVAWSIWGSP